MQTHQCFTFKLRFGKQQRFPDTASFNEPKTESKSHRELWRFYCGISDQFSFSCIHVMFTMWYQFISHTMWTIFVYLKSFTKQICLLFLCSFSWRVFHIKTYILCLKNTTILLIMDNLLGECPHILVIFLEAIIACWILERNCKHSPLSIFTHICVNKLLLLLLSLLCYPVTAYLPLIVCHV